MLDTSVASAILRREEPTLARLKDHHPGDLLITSPVAAEVTFRLRRLAEGSHPRTLLATEYERLRLLLPWTDWTEAAVPELGKQKEALERAGTPVDDVDVIFGPVARAVGAGVATASARDFQKMQGLGVEVWPRS